MLATEQRLKGVLWTGLFGQGVKGAVVLDPCAILIKACHRHFRKTPGNWGGYNMSFLTPVQPSTLIMGDSAVRHVG